MKNLLVGLLMLTPGLVVAQVTYPQSFWVKGKICQLNAPAKIYLTSGPQVLDSATLYKGTFKLKGTADWLHSADLVLEREGRLRDNYSAQAHFRSADRTTVFLEPGPVVGFTAPRSHHGWPSNSRLPTPAVCFSSYH